MLDLKIIKYNFEVLKLVIKTDKFYIFGYILLRIFSAVETVLAYVYLPALVIQLLGNQNKSIKEIIGIIFFFICILVFLKLYIVMFRESYSLKAKEKIKIQMLKDMADVITDVDLIEYDNVDFYNQNINAISQIDDKVVAIIDNLGKFIQYLITIISIIGIMVSFKYTFIIIFILGIAVINTILGDYLNKKEFEYNININILSKRDNYIKRIFYLNNYSKELRTSEISGVAKEYYNNNKLEIEKVLKEKANKTFWLKFLLNYGINILLLYGVILIFLGYKVLQQNILDIGIFAIIINSIVKINSNLSDLTNIIKKIITDSRYIAKYYNFIQKYKKVDEGFVINTIESIDIDNLYFKYPGNQENTLEGISIHLKRGDKVAIVGINGSGKSTLIKIMLGLYSADSGTVKINGIDIEKINRKSLYKAFSFVSQDFNIYSGNIGENVALDVEYNREKVLEKLKQMDFFQNNMNDTKVESNLTKEFDDAGIILSGGQEQKLALARAIYHNGEVVVLDEPTSKIDPISEYNINNELIKTLENRILIIITHRLYTASKADKIIMMSKGKIIGEGNHTTLLSDCKEYAELYNIQYKKYF